MARIIRIAAAQMGPTQRADSRGHTLGRLIALLETAHREGAELVVFPELAFTTFFPRWLMNDDELAAQFETAMPNPDVQALFDRARALHVGFSIGYAEETPDGQRFNSSIIVNADGVITGKYRKVHLPGSTEPLQGATYHQLEKRYFLYGDEGFKVTPGGEELKDTTVGMLICNDRRWPEAWRSLALQGMELLCVGYNSAAYDPNGGSTETAALRTFHSMLVVQSNAYMNACWAVAVAKAGVEDGAGLIGGSCIVDPNGLMRAEAKTLGDEVIIADCDMDLCQQGRKKMFNFEAHRRPQWYQRLTEPVAPPTSGPK
jgi:predicted amidohydrolase